jgi:hypothetical protein
MLDLFINSIMFTLEEHELEVELGDGVLVKFANSLSELDDLRIMLSILLDRRSTGRPSTEASMRVDLIAGENISGTLLLTENGTFQGDTANVYVRWLKDNSELLILLHGGFHTHIEQSSVSRIIQTGTIQVPKI